MHNGATPAPLLYPIKYLNEPFLQYESLLETIIPLAST